MIQRHQKAQDGAHDFDTAESDVASGIEPSWFLDPANDGLRHSLTERYRQARGLLTDVDPTANQRRPLPSERTAWIESRTRPPAGYLNDPRGAKQNAAPRQHDRTDGTGRLAATFVIAAVAAALCGTAAGVINANLDPLKTTVLAMITAPEAAGGTESGTPARARAVNQTVISKKTIATATLDVADVTGEANSLIPLALHAEPGLEGQDLLLQISGLPDTAYLTAGEKSEKVWTLAMDDLKNLKLMIPDDSASRMDVAVAAYERKTGELAAPVKSMSVAISGSGAVVNPASAPPPGAAKPPVAQRPAQEQLSAVPQPNSMGTGLDRTQEAALSKSLQGDGYLLRGDIAAARKLYAEAWSLGSANGAYGLGRSYDPVALAVSKLGKTHADSASAILWYERAAMAGKAEAISAIVRLRLKPTRLARRLAK